MGMELLSSGSCWMGFCLHGSADAIVEVLQFGAKVRHRDRVLRDWEPTHFVLIKGMLRHSYLGNQTSNLGRTPAAGIFWSAVGCRAFHFRPFSGQTVRLRGARARGSGWT